MPRRPPRSQSAPSKAKGRRQKAEGKREKGVGIRHFAFSLLPFPFYCRSPLRRHGYLVVTCVPPDAARAARPVPLFPPAGGRFLQASQDPGGRSECSPERKHRARRREVKSREFPSETGKRHARAPGLAPELRRKITGARQSRLRGIVAGRAASGVHPHGIAVDCGGIPQQVPVRALPPRSRAHVITGCPGAEESP